MYIKYLDNIYNLRNYNGIVKSSTSGGAKDNCIHLLIDGRFIALEFLNTDSRDYILGQIWYEITEKKTYFDIDDIINVYYEAKKYNL